MRVLVQEPEKFKLAIALCKKMGWHGESWKVWNQPLKIWQLKEILSALGSYQKQNTNTK